MEKSDFTGEVPCRIKCHRRTPLTSFDIHRVNLRHVFSMVSMPTTSKINSPSLTLSSLKMLRRPGGELVGGRRGG
ncbi:MAG: hypothetical protein WBA12_08385 [Catalinimonas sp.]